MENPENHASNYKKNSTIRNEREKNWKILKGFSHAVLFFAIIFRIRENRIVVAKTKSDNKKKQFSILFSSARKCTEFSWNTQRW